MVRREAVVLTVALDLNAILKELPGDDLAAEIAGVLRDEHIGHVTLIAEPRGRWRWLARLSLAERLLRLQPHLDVHLVGRRLGQ